MIEINQKVKFNPYHGLHLGGLPISNEKVVGTVKYINTEHRWFSVEYGDPAMRISFNISDIGRNVFLCD